MDPTTLRIKSKALLVYKALYHLRPTNFSIPFPTTKLPPPLPPINTAAISKLQHTSLLTLPGKSQTDSCPRIFALVSSPSHCLKSSTCQHGSFLIIQVSLSLNATSENPYRMTYLKETPSLAPPCSILLYYFLHSTLTICEIILCISLLSIY